MAAAHAEQRQQIGTEAGMHNSQMPAERQQAAEPVPDQSSMDIEDCGNVMPSHAASHQAAELARMQLEGDALDEALAGGQLLPGPGQEVDRCASCSPLAFGQLVVRVLPACASVLA
jgi:hypothetical protein